MKIYFIVLLLLLAGNGVFAQLKNPVSWKFSIHKIRNGTYEVRLLATIEKGWHLYSQTTPAGGPVPTSIKFAKNPLVAVKGDIKEVGSLETHFEKLFGVEVKQYSGKVEFIQILMIKDGVKTRVSGTIEYMTCNDEECLPPKKQPFSVTIK